MDEKLEQKLDQMLETILEAIKAVRPRTRAPSKSLTLSEKKQAEVLYRMYPRSKGGAVAITAISRAIGRVGYDFLVLKVRKYAELINKEQTEDRFIPYPERWFRDSRWSEMDNSPREAIAAAYRQQQRDKDKKDMARRVAKL